PAARATGSLAYAGGGGAIVGWGDRLPRPGVPVSLPLYGQPWWCHPRTDVGSGGLRVRPDRSWIRQGWQEPGSSADVGQAAAYPDGGSGSCDVQVRHRVCWATGGQPENGHQRSSQADGLAWGDPARLTPYRSDLDGYGRGADGTNWPATRTPRR